MKEKSALELNAFKQKYNCYNSIGDLTPTICAAFNVEEPSSCGAVAIAPIVDQIARTMGEGKMEKAVLFCCDAMGEHQRDHFPEVFNRIEKVAPFRIPSVAVMPSVTPVCYGTIFTGAAPCVHGIQKYEKPVLKVETLFDVMAKANKNVAIVAYNNCSIDTIFRLRNVDYYSFRTDAQSFNCTLELIEKNQYDLIISYMTDYDAKQHKTGCFSKEATQQAYLATDRFEELSRAIDTYYKDKNRMLVFVPDHGGHLVEKNCGTHGFDIPEDMLVSHYYSLRKAQKDA
jgi:predicted AlkP superfamily pyrophosphatase or phosphodiesterase